MRRQEPDGREVDRPVGEELERDREPAGGPGRRDAVISLLLGEPEDVRNTNRWLTLRVALSPSRNKYPIYVVGHRVKRLRKSQKGRRMSRVLRTHVNHRTHR